MRLNGVTQRFNFANLVPFHEILLTPDKSYCDKKDRSHTMFFKKWKRKLEVRKLSIVEGHPGSNPRTCGRKCQNNFQMFFKLLTACTVYVARWFWRDNVVGQYVRYHERHGRLTLFEKNLWAWAPFPL